MPGVDKSDAAQTDYPPKPPKLPGSGRHRVVWCAYEENKHEGTVVLFGNELTALRYAADNHMRCKAVDFGVPLLDQLK